jgi:hypothetical protein
MEKFFLVQKKESGSFEEKRNLKEDDINNLVLGENYAIKFVSSKELFGVVKTCQETNKILTLKERVQVKIISYERLFPENGKKFTYLVEIITSDINQIKITMDTINCYLNFENTYYKS